MQWLVTQPAECLVDGAMDLDGVVAVGAHAAGAPAAGALAAEEVGEVLAASTELLRSKFGLLSCYFLLLSRSDTLCLLSNFMVFIYIYLCMLRSAFAELIYYVSSCIVSVHVI